MIQTPPLSLYIHLPWCIQKCPYCDFNSHALRGDLPERAYIDALLLDLELDLPNVWGRTVHSIFIGGGTPSLFSAEAIAGLLGGVSARLPLSPGIEITLEANPGTVEHDRFEGYRDAGVNRISLGIQSFNDQHLQSLGRIHGSREAHLAIEAVQRAGFERINLDLMWALPKQSLAEMLEDLKIALSYDTGHLSHYQLTLEPNTVFAAHPPTLPDETLVIEMSDESIGPLETAGYEPYEISAWAKKGHASKHNLNYWQFGDYLGIGAGAHGKITLAAQQQVIRTRRKLVPHSYLQAAKNRSFVAEQRSVNTEDLAFEYFLNRFRLATPIAWREFEERTGLTRDSIKQPLERAEALSLVEVTNTHLTRTALGARYLNDLQQLCLD
jgi:putative oxygen-independent coproporphyrinogen III oxidase